MYCKVIYYSEQFKGFSGREYTYRTSLPVRCGDKVLCPISGQSEQKRAMITKINVPESEIDDSWRDRIKEITSFDYVDVQPVREQ